MGTIIAVIVYGSELGVMTAAKIAMNRMAPRRHSRIFWLDITPTSERKTSTTGNSKESPKASARSMTNPRNRSPVSRGTNPEPANPSRKPSPFGRVKYAMTAPRANRTTEEATNGTASRRSRLVRPGTTKAHSCHRTIGRAKNSPRNTTTLSLMTTGSMTPVNTNLQPVGGRFPRGRFRIVAQ